MYRRSLTISKNAPSKEHAICMQAFLHAAKLLATINEEPNERNTLNGSVQSPQTSGWKMSSSTDGSCTKHHFTHTTRAFCFTAVQTTDSRRHGFCWSGSPRHGLPSRTHVARAEWNTLNFSSCGPKRHRTAEALWERCGWRALDSSNAQ